MKTKQQIMDDYAKEHGFNDWYDFALHHKVKGYSTHSFLKHQNIVIDLIQDELKKKIALQEFGENPSYSEYVNRKKSILNTPNL